MLIQFAILPIVGIARGLGPSPFKSWSQRLLCERRDVSCRWVAFLQSTAAQFRVSCRSPGFRSIDRRGHHRRIAMVVHFSGSICDTWSDHDFCGPGLPARISLRNVEVNVLHNLHVIARKRDFVHSFLLVELTLEPGQPVDSRSVQVCSENEAY